MPQEYKQSSYKYSVRNFDKFNYSQIEIPLFELLRFTNHLVSQVIRNQGKLYFQRQKNEQLMLKRRNISSSKSIFKRRSHSRCNYVFFLIMDQCLHERPVKFRQFKQFGIECLGLPVQWLISR